MNKKTLSQYGLALSALYAAGLASAEPTTYRFVTGNAPTGNPFLSAQLAGSAVAGTFRYEANASPGGALPNGAAAYPATVTDFSARVAGLPITDPAGLVVVGDDKPFGASVGDGIVYSADPAVGSGSPPVFFNLQGFDLEGFQLANVRLFWLENINGEDFLSNQMLPPHLPGFIGRLALDFVSPENPTVAQFVFFDDLRVSLEVGVDVQPGSDTGCLHIDGAGVVPVAVLGAESFDVTTIDQSSLLFGGLGVRVRGNKGPLCHFDDADGNAYVDLVCQFEDDSASWVAGSGEANLTGQLVDGASFVGTDTICVVPR